MVVIKLGWIFEELSICINILIKICKKQFLVRGELVKQLREIFFHRAHDLLMACNHQISKSSSNSKSNTESNTHAQTHTHTSTETHTYTNKKKCISFYNNKMIGSNRNI